MNYREALDRATAYIEEHLDGPLTVEEIAGCAGYSVYHFCRVFSLCRGLSVMEYVRAQRLAHAAEELFAGKRTIDAALSWGFESPGGFAKAFRRAYGYSPTQYAARMAGRPTTALQGKETITMNVRFVKQPAFKVAGYGIETDVSGASYTRDIAAFWEHYDGENLETRLYEILKPDSHGEYGLCVPSGGGGNVLYLLGVAVEDFRSVPPEMQAVEVPEAEYAVFTTPPVDTRGDPAQTAFAEAIHSTWKYIFEQWFPESGYAFDSGKPDFEFYDERCHWLAETVGEIWIPIVKR